MRARQDNLLQHHARRGRALGAVVLCVGVGCCGEAPRRQAPDDGVVAGVWAERQALGAHVDAALREAVGEALSSMLSEGQLRGRGIWQRGAVRRPGHAPPLALGDEADDGIVDGYSYKAYVTPPPPRTVSLHDDCIAQSSLAPCGNIDAQAHVVIERVGGIAGATSRSDTLMAYRQDDSTSLCACPSSTLTERLPLCCASLCCH